MRPHFQPPDAGLLPRLSALLLGAAVSNGELMRVTAERDALAAQVAEIRLALEDPTETRTDELAARIAGWLAEQSDDIATMYAKTTRLDQELASARRRLATVDEKLVSVVERRKNVLADFESQHSAYVRERDLRFAAEGRVTDLTREVNRLRRELEVSDAVAATVPVKIAAAHEACAQAIWEEGTEPFPGTEGDYPSQKALQAARDAGTCRGLARREDWDALQELLNKAFLHGVEHATKTVIEEKKEEGRG